MAKFYGIGVGPGDSELLTIKAVRILSIIDAVILPEAKKDTGSIAYNIAKEYINPKADIIYCEFPMVTDKKIILKAGLSTAKIVEKLVAADKNVAFITLGDPSVYSTYSYIVKGLDKTTEIETIPGITSFCASAALTNKPLVEGDEILSIVPATASEELIDKAAEISGGLVMMKIHNHKDKILKVLNKHEMKQNSVIVKRCGMEDCSISRDIEKTMDENKQYLSILISRKEQNI